MINNNNTDNDMRVTKRDGNLEEMSFDKILNRISFCILIFLVFLFERC